MDGRCSTCRWWDENCRESRQGIGLAGMSWDSGDDGKGFGTCRSPKLHRGYDRDRIGSDEFLVEDDEMWGIVVGADFGCIHWESQDAESDSGVSGPAV